MEEQVDLTQGQRLYLQFILDTFRAECQWPTHDRLDQFLYQTDPDMDIEDIWKSLPPGLTSYLDMNLLNNSASLTLKGIYALEPEAPEFVLFLQVLNLCVQTHASAQTIRSDDILGSHPDWDVADVQKMGWLLFGEGHLWQSFSGPGSPSSWTCTLKRQIRRFSDVRTMDAYWEKCDAVWPRPPVSPPSGGLPLTDSRFRNTLPENGIDLSTENTALWQQVTMHPDIHERCWNLYMQGDYDNAIFTATRAIEVAVRRKAHLPDALVGVDVIVQAFRPASPLLLYSNVVAEQEGMMALLRGVIMVYKNPQSHRHVGVQNKSECLAILLMCSNLLYMIDGLSLQAGA